MSQRKYRLVDLNPRWVEDTKGVVRYITFDCPEAGHHEGWNCHHTIPFSPALDGTVIQRDGAQWGRRGEKFESLTLIPSIRRNKTVHPDTGEVIDPCEMHIHITDGKIDFCGDSK